MQYNNRKSTTLNRVNPMTTVDVTRELITLDIITANGPGVSQSALWSWWVHRDPSAFWLRENTLILFWVTSTTIDVTRELRPLKELSILNVKRKGVTPLFENIAFSEHQMNVCDQDEPKTRANQDIQVSAGQKQYSSP